MNIVVFGANGRVGSLVVLELLKRGHEVTAFVHGSNSFDEQPELRVVEGDIYEESSVSSAMSGADAIVSALGSWGTSRKDVLTEAMRRIIPVAEATDIARIVSLTGADARAPADRSSWLHATTRRLFLLLAGKVLRDGERHIELLSDSSLEWTVVRSPAMKDTGKPTYALDNRRPKPWQTIPRSAVVQAMCDLVESSERVEAAPFIHHA